MASWSPLARATAREARRRHPRAAVPARVERWDGEPGYWAGVNVGEGGMAVVGKEKLPLGSRLWVKVLLTDAGIDTEIRCQVEVAWVARAGRLTRMGVRFVGLEPDDAFLIRAVVKRRVQRAATPRWDPHPDAAGQIFAPGF